MTDRALVLERLSAERREAIGCYEYERAAQLQAQIEQMSAGSTVNPAAEQAAKPVTPGRQRRAPSPRSGPARRR